MSSKLYYLTIFLFIIIIGVHHAMPDEMNWQTSLWPEQHNMQLYSEDFGQAVAVGDVNGDGFDDVIVSSDYFIYIYEGPLPAQDGWIWAKPMVKIGNRHANYIPHFDKVTLADVNNDGIMDILFGEDFVYQDNSPWFIYLFYGRTEWTTSDEPLELDDHEDCDWSVGSPSSRPGGSFGFSMANAGDVNADGIDDIIVGAPTDQDKGKAYVYYGSSTGMEPNQTPDGIIPPNDTWQMWQRGIGHRIEGSLGYTVARDGHYIGSQGYISDNFIIGVPGADIDLNENGYYSEYEGEQDIGIALIGPRWWCLSGDTQRGVQFGYVLGNAGDVNGDGHSEVLICAKKYAVPPKIFLYLGSDDRVNTSVRDIPYDWSIINIPYAQTIYPSSYQKPSVGSAGDINGDGYGDIFIGDPSYNTDNTLGRDGRVYIFYGGPPTNDDPTGLGQNQTIETADIILEPSSIGFSFVPNSCITFGYSVASGDIDGDGLSDIVVGDPEAYHPEGGTNPGVTSGAVHIFYGGEPQPQGPTYIRVTSPNGGEVWYVGEWYNITWESDSYVGTVKIEISTNGGSSWWDITQGNSTPNDGQYRYRPNTESENCLFKITSDENPSAKDQSDGVFAVRSGSTTSDVTFTVTTPFSTPPEDDIYIAGSFNSWDPGPGQAGTDGQQHDLPLTKITDNQWQITIPLTSNEEVQYKYTRGSWNNYETGAGGIEIPNRVLTVPGNNFTKNDAVMCWVDLACFINMLTNGDFSDGDNGWTFYSHSPASATGTVINGEYTVNITNGGTEEWHVQLNQYDLNIENGKQYMVAFEAHASAGRTLYTSVGKNASPYTNYSAHEQFTISTSEQTYTYSFTMNEPTDPAARLIFDLGLSDVDVFLDNVLLMETESTGFWADVDDDGDVDIIDIQLVAAHWNTKAGDQNYDARYDVDNEGTGDGDIDIIDIQLVAAWWNQPLPPGFSD